MYIHAFVVVCLFLNPTQCREIEIAPSDYRPITSVLDCMMGGAIFGGVVIFDRDGVQWDLKGVRCREVEPTLSDIQKRLRSAVR